MFYSKDVKFAFTLAEILLTLVVIGVVAAMTIPILINDFNEEAYRTMFKKKYSEILQVYNKITMENAGYYKCSYFGLDADASECQRFYSDLTANYNVVKTCNADDHKSLGNCIPAGGILKQDGTEVGSPCHGLNLAGQNNSNVFVFNDGTYMFVYGSGGEGKWWPIFSFDVNGLKKPNQWGKDVFSFIIRENKIEFYSCGYSGENLLLGQS